MDATWISDYSWFIGCGLGFAALAVLEKANPMIRVPSLGEESVVDGALAP